eukprot:CCRYP_015668-RA/>CCRYP_015668-RA protein AED:0.32 eAED:0.32 QI:1593/1/1/1/0/0/2/41/73
MGNGGDFDELLRFEATQRDRNQRKAHRSVADHNECMGEDLYRINLCIVSWVGGEYRGININENGAPACLSITT